MRRKRWEIVGDWGTVITQHRTLRSAQRQLGRFENGYYPIISLMYRIRKVTPNG